MGTGCAKGQGRARQAAEMAVSSPLLDNISVDGATGILLNVVGGPDMKINEIKEASEFIQEQAHEDANIIFGASIDPALGEMVKVTVIATGFDRAIVEESPVSGNTRVTMPSGFSSQSHVAHAVQPQRVAAVASRVTQTEPLFQHAASTNPPPRSRRESSVCPAPATSREVAIPASATAYTSPSDQEWEIPAYIRNRR
jgi:cell division protein FtsZ